MPDRSVPVEAFPPGEYISDELDARGWTQEDLADVTGISRRQIINLITNKSGITAPTAHALAEAFGQNATTWMELQAAYELAQAAQLGRDTARRSKIYTKVPVRDLKRRGWIEDIDGTEALERSVCRLLQIKSIDETPPLSVAARKGTAYSGDNPAQIAWFARAHEIAHAAPAVTYSEGNLESGIQALRKLAAYPEDTKHVPRTLAQMGIRLLLIEHLPKSKVDGVAFWIDEGRSPVIAMSLRYDRIDNFWQTLLHEIIHIKYRDASPVDENLFDCESATTGLPPIEVRANSEACEYLIPQEWLTNFVRRHGRAIYESDVVQAAQGRGVHPGILVGQLHWRKALDWKFQRKLLVKIRHELLGVALTDGWGHMPKL